MRKRSAIVVAVACTAGLANILPATSRAQLSSNVQVYASGLNGPRGLEFGPDGQLYVAEAGTGGSTSPKGQCTQVIPPIGPYTGGPASRISRISSEGKTGHSCLRLSFCRGQQYAARRTWRRRPGFS